MEDTEKSKIVKVKKPSKVNIVPQIMTVAAAGTIRGIVRTVNEIGIRREDIVSLIKDTNQYILVYYK